MKPDVLQTFSSLDALQRARYLLDADSFSPLTDTSEAVSLLAGAGAVGGRPVWIALMDGHVRGGTIGLREAGILARLAEQVMAARQQRRRPVLILAFDTGGVRVEEGPIALAAASAVGVALARLTLLGVRVVGIVSGPRGCFGAPSVMAALPERVIVTAPAHWGLTGPKLLGDILDGAVPGADALAATSAESRLANGDAHCVVADEADAVRAALFKFVVSGARRPRLHGLDARIVASAERTAKLCARLKRAEPAMADIPVRGRRRDLLRYSFRGQWKPSGPIQRTGLIHAAIGTLAQQPALGLIVGPEQIRGGVGIEEAAVVTDMVRQLAEQPDAVRAPILTFLFCQGHAVDYAQERFGLPSALAECLRALVAARLLGHPIISVLGGGTYGAAYLALAAPSHRILAMRGTSVAPMAPRVLRAFQQLRGQKPGYEPGTQLAQLIPDIRIVDSVIRLPRVLREELTSLVETVRPDVHAA